MAAWTWVVTDLAGVVQGELRQASERQLALPLSRIPQASAKLRLDNPLVPRLMTGEAMLKCYRNSSLLFHGNTVAAEEVADSNSQTVAVTWAGAAWRFTHRLIGKGTSAGGYKQGFSMGTAAQPIDRITIARNMLQVCNSDDYTGVTLGTSTASTPTAIGPVQFEPLSDLIAKLAASDTGFDWEVAPTEPGNVGQNKPQIGLFNAAAVFGSRKPNAIFEYGRGRANVASYSRQMSLDGLLNVAWILYPGHPNASSQAVIGAGDTPSFNKWGLMESLVQGGDVVQDNFRQQLVNLHVAVRKNPRTIITLTPYRDAKPQPIVDYNVGDQIRFRATVEGNQRIDVWLRIWGITFNVDANGVETVELELIPPA